MLLKSSSKPSERQLTEYFSKLMEKEPFSLSRAESIAQEMGDPTLTMWAMPTFVRIFSHGPKWMWQFKLSSAAKVQAHPEDIFSDIEAHDEVKLTLLNLIKSEGNVNILLLGDSSTGKSMFIRDIREHFPSIYTEGGGATAVGIREAVRKKITETGTTKIFLLIDELDKMVSRSKEATSKFLDQDSLANLIDTSSRLVKTKYSISTDSDERMTYDTRMEGFKVIATANYLYNISPILRARFGAPIQFRQYTKDEAYHIGKRLLSIRYHLPEKLAEKTALFVTESMPQINLREFDKIGQLIHTESDLENYKRII